jgi:hypothetical protein
MTICIAGTGLTISDTAAVAHGAKVALSRIPQGIAKASAMWQC